MEALRTGDAIALGEVYDAYAPLLYHYCHGLLRDRVEAAGALRNTVIAAREHADRLAEPDRLRGWLYALARKECLRRRDSPHRRTGEEARETDDGSFPEQAARRADDRVIAHSALAALTGLQREALDLAVRHELDEVDLAGVLGVPLEETYHLVERARTDLAAAARATLIAWHHRGECPDAAALADAWPLAASAAGRLVQHVEGCPACGAQRVPQPSGTALLGALPVAALPGDLRPDVLTAATARDRADNRRAIAAWAEPFDEYGRPLPYAPPAGRARDRTRRRRPLLLTVGAGVAVLTVIGGTMTAFGGEDRGRDAPVPVTADTGGPVTVAEPAPPRPTAGSTARSRPPSPTPSKTPTATPSPSTSATRNATERSAAPRTSRPTTPPRAGVLSVESCDMHRRGSCHVRITAVGGPVTWRVTGTSGVEAGGGGRLGAGESAEIRVSRARDFCWGEQRGTVEFAPGGTAVVEYDC